jgi:hypothetical protein
VVGSEGTRPHCVTSEQPVLFLVTAMGTPVSHASHICISSGVWMVTSLLLHVYRRLLYLMCFCCTVCVLAVLTSDARLLARSQYPEGPATGHLNTGFSWFPCVYKRMLRWFPSFQVATTCLSCSPPDLNFLVTFFSYFCTCKTTTATG